MAEAGKPQQVPEIVAVPLVRTGYDYLTRMWPSLLRGGIGRLTLNPDAQRLLEALNQVATGGTLQDLRVTGGNAGELNNLLQQSINDANTIGQALGVAKWNS